MAVAGNIPWVYMLLAVGLLVGYAGHRMFRRWHVSDILLMLWVGVLLGPVTRLVDPAPLAPAFAFLAPLALVIVLFEGGLELAWDELRKHAAKALTFSLASWILATAALTLVVWRMTGTDLVLSLLFAAAVAATGILAVIPLLQQLGVQGQAKVLLTVETSLGDLLSAVAVTAISGVLLLGATPVDGAMLLGVEFLVGASVGILAGLATARALYKIAPEKHGYPVLLACVMLAYAAAEFIGGSGFLAALAFGLLIGNANALTSFGGLSALAPPGKLMRMHQTEIIFLLRSSYFLFLGIALPAQFLTWPYALFGLAMTGAVIGARLLTVALAGVREDRMLVAAMMPRGLATAVLAGLPFAMGVPGTEAFVGYAFLLIVGADIATSAGLWIGRRKAAPAPKPIALDGETPEPL